MHFVVHRAAGPEALAAVGQVHEVLHGEGSVRLVSYLKLETRTDKEPTLPGKRL